MTAFQSGLVTKIIGERPGLQKVLVEFANSHDGERTYNLTELTGEVAVGDRVVCNTTAVRLGLGTGGWHFVHWNTSLDELHVPGGGHVMKMRYTSLQRDTGVVEEHHGQLALDLQGIPVVACSLHSQVGVVAAAYAHFRPGARLAYVMTDGAALPLALSDLVFDLCQRGLLCGTVTAGHAFGGTHEAVNIRSALSICKTVLQADAIVVGMGPGVVGTGSTLGTTALEVTEILHSVIALNGQAIACLRVSSGDGRGRHQGLSHHTLTALSHVRPGSPFITAVPLGHDTDLTAITAGATGQRIEAIAVPDTAGLLERFDLHITTMGRKPAEDHAFFQFAAAAGAVAATMGR